MRYNFLGVDPADCDGDRPRFAVLPLPYDATVSYQAGTRHGPQAIIEASQQVELFDDELFFEAYHAGVCTLDAPEPTVSSPEAMHEVIFEAAREPVRAGQFLFGLGGEHGVTSGLVRAIAEHYAPKGHGLSILQLDAHLDLRDSYQGSRYSHASVMRRCLDYADNVVPLGIRTMCAEEHAFLTESGIRPIFARDCRQDDQWIDRAIEALGERVYVTLDIDGLDPGYAPGTGTPEPGGLDWRQVTLLLGEVARRKTIVAADIVEVMPIPGQAVTEFLAARLAYKLMTYVIASEQERL